MSKIKRTLTAQNVIENITPLTIAHLRQNDSASPFSAPLTTTPLGPIFYLLPVSTKNTFAVSISNQRA